MANLNVVSSGHSFDEATLSCSRNAHQGDDNVIFPLYISLWWTSSDEQVQQCVPGEEMPSGNWELFSTSLACSEDGDNADGAGDADCAGCADLPKTGEDVCKNFRA